MRFIDREEVARRLTYDICIPIVRDAMIAFSAGETKQLLRSIIPLAEGHLFGIMPGALGAKAPFGAKLISIFPENAAQGRQSHQGLIILFEPDTGTPVCVVHAGEVTAIRTAAASAVATDALARKDAKHLAILGTGEQATTHARAIRKVRALESITVWGRSPERAQAFATKMQGELGIPTTAIATVQQAVANADIVCTVTSAIRTHPQIGMGPARPAHQRSRLQPRRPGRNRQRISGSCALLRRQPRRRPPVRAQNFSAPNKPASSTTTTSSPKSARCWPAQPKAAARAMKSPSTNR